MQIRNTDGSKISDLSTLPVWTMMNINISGNDLASMMNGTTTASELSNKMYNTTLLSSCVKSISPSWSEGTIHRPNGQRVIEAECDPDITNHNATPAKVVENIAEEIKAIPLPEGYGMRFAGEGETSDESMDIIMSFLPIMVAIIVIILLLLFNSWKKAGGDFALLPIRYMRHYTGLADNRHSVYIPCHTRSNGLNGHDD